MFNNMGRIGSDATDHTQKNLYNQRFGNYTVSNYFSNNNMDSDVEFASTQPTMNISGISNGKGLNGNVVDMDSQLLIKIEQERSLEKVQLFQRPFLTVPYLGRGYGDPLLESQLLQGENSNEKKSVSTIMEQSFIGYTSYPLLDDISKRLNDPAYSVEEAALDGWVRGGSATREMSFDPAFAKTHRPTDKSY